MEKVNITRRVFLLAEPNSELLVTPFQYLIIKGRCTLLATQSGKKKVKLTRKTALTAYPGSTAFISDKQYKHVKGSCEIAPTKYDVMYSWTGDGVPVDRPEPPATVSYVPGEAVQVEPEPTSYNTEFRFGGWSSYEDDIDISSGSFYMPNHPVRIRGTWYYRKVKISFGVVDEQGPEDFYMDPVYTPYWQTYNLPIPEQTWPGWNFAYWVAEDEPTKALDPGGEFDPIYVHDTDIKLLAFFKKAE